MSKEAFNQGYVKGLVHGIFLSALLCWAAVLLKALIALIA